MLPIWYSNIYTDGLDQLARFPRERYRMVRDCLRSRGLPVGIDFFEPERLDEEDLLLVHDADYVHNFIGGTLSRMEQRRIGLQPWTEQMVERTLVLTGGTVAAASRAVDQLTVTANLGGGTHHAYRDFGSGYCIFNDLAVAARVVQRDFDVGPVLIIDLDVHQGDGTAAIFEDDLSVTTASIHCAENFPFRKMRSDFDIEFSRGTTDGDYIDSLQQLLESRLSGLEIDLIFFQAGVDALETDRLGHLSLSRDGMMRRNELVFDFARAVEAPLVVTMGGGYGDPIQTSVEAHADLFTQAAGYTSY